MSGVRHHHGVVAAALVAFMVTTPTVAFAAATPCAPAASPAIASHLGQDPVLSPDAPAYARRDTVLAWDDGDYGSAGNRVTGQVGMALAVGFQAPPWATHLVAIQYFIMDDGVTNPNDPNAPTTAPFMATVWSPNAGVPGVRRLEYIPFPDFYSYPEDTWVEVWLPNPVDLTNAATFPDREFFVGLEWLYRNNPVIGLDVDPPIDLNTFRWNWSVWETLTFGDAMIRAVVWAEDIVPPNTIYVDLAGGGDYPTIGEGVAAAVNRDTVYVAPGTYMGPSNRDISFEGRNIVLKSEGGRARTIIDCQGEGRGFYLVDGTDETALIEGFTVRNGSGSGGGIRCVNAYPTVSDCVFEDCDGEGYGGGAFLTNPVMPSPLFENCVFARNVASLEGGAVRLDFSDPVFRNCTMYGNAAPDGGGVCCGTFSFPTFENCIIAFSSEGAAVSCPDASVATVFHSCVFGNAGGDSLCGLYWENLFEDPLLCDPSTGDYRIHESSPAAPTGNPWSELIGARGPGCEQTLIEATSWGRIKAMYR